MNKKAIQRFLELQKQLEGDFDRREACLKRLKRKYKLSYSEACKHPDYRTLVADEHRLRSETEALTPHVIRANLERFGIDDLVVLTGMLRIQDHSLRGEVERPLSELCASLGSIDVIFHGKIIGRIDEAGVFHYTSAPNLRAAIGWLIATNDGRERLIDDFDLDQAAQLILETIRSNGMSRDAYFEYYFKALGRILLGRFSFHRVYEEAVAKIFWAVATRELGKEHPGYPYPAVSSSLLY